MNMSWAGGSQAQEERRCQNKDTRPPGRICKPPDRKEAAWQDSRPPSSARQSRQRGGQRRKSVLRWAGRYSKPGVGSGSELL